MHPLRLCQICWRLYRTHSLLCEQLQLTLQGGPTKADAGEPGTFILGVKLQGAERWKAWGAVVLFTLISILQAVGTFMPAYLNEQVCTCRLIPSPSGTHL